MDTQRQVNACVSEYMIFMLIRMLHSLTYFILYHPLHLYYMYVNVMRKYDGSSICTWKPHGLLPPFILITLPPYDVSLF
jgi:hypothetical protein